MSGWIPMAPDHPFISELPTRPGEIAITINGTRYDWYGSPRCLLKSVEDKGRYIIGDIRLIRGHLCVAAYVFDRREVYWTLVTAYTVSIDETVRLIADLRREWFS